MTPELEKKIKALSLQLSELLPSADILISIVVGDDIYTAYKSSCNACLLERTLFAAIEDKICHQDGSELLSDNDEVTRH